MLSATRMASLRHRPLTDLLEYDEEDNGFSFTRTRSKRAKAAQTVQSVQVPEAVVEEEPVKAKSAPARKPRKKSLEPSAAVPTSVEEAAPSRRRSTRNSGGNIAAEAPEIQVPKRRARKTTPEARPEINGTTEKGGEEQGKEQMNLVQVKSTTPVRDDSSNAATKITLPFADTPIMRRNKEMRKAGDGSRRSSLGMRGRRASSLIDSGTSNGMLICR